MTEGRVNDGGLSPVKGPLLYPELLLCGRGHTDMGRNLSHNKIRVLRNGSFIGLHVLEKL
ncbi:hypothetical protein PAMP_022212 [Pampus punctatissimus]